MGASTPTPLSGRDDELRTLLEVVRLGTSGSPQAVLVQGEAGVGKTTLVRAVVEQARADGAQVLWGQALRFGAVEAAYHPLVLALEGWLAGAGDAERAAIIEQIPTAALVLPSVGAAAAESGSHLMTVVDALIRRVVARGPTVLVVDDVQWADPSTWDALAYLVAGFAQQPFVLLATQRDEQAGPVGFQRWLGSLVRLPGTRELRMTRLGRGATEHQMAKLLGGDPSSRLVDQVYERSRGNPYFTELLVRRTPLGTTDLPDAVPDQLSRALLENWHALSGLAREMTRLLAVAGRPTTVTTLSKVGAAMGVEVVGSLREAVDAGVTVVEEASVWFRHPLLADVLVDSYLPGEAVPVHAAWAEHLAATTADGVDELRRLGDLATHQHLSGTDAEAFGTLLRAADVAETLRVRREAGDLLVRAVDLWGTGAPNPDDDVAHARLLERAGRACNRADRIDDAWRLIGHARDLVDPGRDPLWSSTLQILHDDLSWGLGLVDDHAQGRGDAALELTSGHVDSREHAHALAYKAEILYWAGQLVEALALASDAIAAAERSGSDGALSHAYGVRSMLVLKSDLEQAHRDAATAWEHAFASDDLNWKMFAFVTRTRLKEAGGDLGDLLVHAREWREWDQSVGLGGLESLHLLTGVLLAVGDLVAVEPAVRTGLATSGSVNDEVATRLHAAVLAGRRGALDAAEGHLARAYEVLPFLEERTGLQPSPHVAEVLLALGRPGDALAVVERSLALNAADSTMLDRLLLWGSRTAAHLVQRDEDARDQDAVLRHRAALERLVDERAGRGTSFAPTGPRDSMTRAQGALCDAETGLVRGDPDQLDRWRAAVAVCAEAGMWWEHHGAAVRLAAALVETGADRQEAGRLLRAAHAYALEQRAVPLAARVEEVAAMGRIALTAPAEAPVSVPRTFAGLTARETEVLGHLVANRTYAEIAAQLVISEKTVSVHVSNLLRKTQTSSRREVAALARRLGWSDAPGVAGG